MKRIISLIMLCAACIGMMANPVGLEEARSKAAKFLASSRTARVKNLQTLEKSLSPVETDFSHLYVFDNGQDGGFVVVSADDRTESVLAYSEGGSYADVPKNGGMHEILTGLNSQVSDASKDFFSSRNDTEIQEQDREPVYPLISTTWNGYDPYYYFCPMDPNTGNRTLVGCVAITLAQIMKYYEYPKKTTISIPAYTTSSGIQMPKLAPTTFEYDKMLDYYTPDDNDVNNYTEEQLAAVQKILKYAGSAVKMEYSSEGSASTFDVALIAKYFGYRNDATLLHAAQFPRATWEEMIYNELAAGRPVPYSAGAVLQQNHSFIIDGYDGRGYFHANTADYGYYAGLFYCKLHVINEYETGVYPVESSGYNCYQSAIFNFQPADSSQPLQDLPAGENMEGKVSKIVVDGVHFYNPYAGQKTVAVVNLSNQGETFENYLFLWQGGKLKGGVGTYIPPGESGEVVICIAAPETPGNYPVRFTTDWDGNDVVYETKMEIVDQPALKLSSYVIQEGFKGLNYVNEENGEEPYWKTDKNWNYETGIYESLKIEADITNTSNNRYNSWISSELFEHLPDGEGYHSQGKEIVRHFYYVDLAPGETKHFSFFFDKHLFNPDNMYFYRLDYNDKMGPVLFSLPNIVPYFPSMPELKGDADNDGLINIMDVTVIINYILNKNPSPFSFNNADVNGDGLINMLDVTEIINIVLNK